MAFFMYEDEQGRWQNRLNEFWVRVDDRAKITGRTSTALWNKISELVVSFLNKTFGARLFSARSVIASVNLSFVIIWVCLIVVFITSLARIIHDCEDTKSLFCYKHVVETVFVVAREAFACPTIARHSVCCSPIFSPSLPCCSSIIGRAVPMAEPC